MTTENALVPVSNSVQAQVKIEDAVLIVSARVDVIEVLRELAKRTDNKIDDQLVEMLALARSNADWKGYAKGIL